MSFIPFKRFAYTLVFGLAVGVVVASAQVAVSPEISPSFGSFTGDCALCSTELVSGSAPLDENVYPVDLSLWGHLSMPYRDGSLSLRGNGASGPAADWLGNSGVLFSNGVSPNQTAWENHLATGPSFLNSLSWPGPMAPFQYADAYTAANPYLGVLNTTTSSATNAFYGALGNPFSFFSPAMPGPALGFYP